MHFFAQRCFYWISLCVTWMHYSNTLLSVQLRSFCLLVCRYWDNPNKWESNNHRHRSNSCAFQTASATHCRCRCQLQCTVSSPKARIWCHPWICSCGIAAWMRLNSPAQCPLTRTLPMAWLNWTPRRLGWGWHISSTAWVHPGEPPR